MDDFNDLRIKPMDSSIWSERSSGVNDDHLNSDVMETSSDTSPLEDSDRRETNLDLNCSSSIKPSSVFKTIGC
jgi:hypothetical protein